MVSVIMPVYNAEAYVANAIRSVLNQEYPKIELLVVNDGSSDRSESEILSVMDDRIRYFSQVNQGVSAARNLALQHMRGDYFCFLDADDLMPAKSITCRLAIFDGRAELAFVGGAQEQRNQDLSDSLVLQMPSYRGNPRAGLVALDPGCFINCGTWLIRRDSARNYAFPVGWTHSEDLAFFLSISDQGELDFTTEVVQIYRRHASAMSDLEGLHDGYGRFIQMVERCGFASATEVEVLKRKVRHIMFRSYLRAGKMVMALRVVFFQKLNRW